MHRSIYYQFNFQFNAMQFMVYLQFIELDLQTLIVLAPIQIRRPVDNANARAGTSDVAHVTVVVEFAWANFFWSHDDVFNVVGAGVLELIQ